MGETKLFLKSGDFVAAVARVGAIRVDLLANLAEPAALLNAALLAGGVVTERRSSSSAACSADWLGLSKSWRRPDKLTQRFLVGVRRQQNKIRVALHKLNSEQLLGVTRDGEFSAETLGVLPLVANRDLSIEYQFIGATIYATLRWIEPAAATCLRCQDALGPCVYPDRPTPSRCRNYSKYRYV